jgi:hypothetical protein
MTKLKTREDVEAAFVKVRCKLCGLGWHFAGFAPRTNECFICDPRPNGKLRTHHHNRKHPRRRLRHIIDGKQS